MKIVERIKNLAPGVKASIALFLSSMVTKGISYITMPIFTRMLSTEEYGQVSLYFTWMEIFGIIAMFCLSYGVFNNGMIDNPDKRDEYSFSMLVLSNIITLAFTGILLCLYPLLKPLIGLDWPFIILMCVVFIFQPAYNFWSARQRYELKYKLNVVFSIVSSIITPAVAILCIYFGPWSKLYSRIFGMELAAILFYMAFYIFLIVKNKGKLNTKYWKSAIIFNLPLIPHYLSTYLLGSSDKIMISYLISETATAYYSVAYSVAAVVLVVWSAINSSLIPYTYEKCQKEEYKSISKVTLPILGLFAVACVVIILMAPEIIKIVAPNNYMEAIYAIPPIVGGVFFQVHYYIYANLIYYFKKPKYVMLASITATVANIILNYFCIKKWGYLAAGYTTLVCYLIQAAIDYFAMRKVVGRSVYNMKLITVLSIVVIFISILSNMIYDQLVVRYVILSVIILGLLIFSKKIIKLFKTMKGDKI